MEILFIPRMCCWLIFKIFDLYFISCIFNSFLIFSFGFRFFISSIYPPSKLCLLFHLSPFRLIVFKIILETIINWCSWSHCFILSKIWLYNSGNYWKAKKFTAIESSSSENSFLISISIPYIKLFLDSNFSLEYSLVLFIFSICFLLGGNSFWILIAPYLVTLAEWFPNWGPRGVSRGLLEVAVTCN